MWWRIASYALIAALGFSGGGVAFLLWPWAPFVALGFACGLGAGLGLVVALLLPGRSRGDDPAGWRGIPAKWLSSGRRVARLAIASRPLAEDIATLCPRAEIQHVVVKENDARDLAFLAMAVVAVASPLVWWLAHPSVRVVNTSYEPLIVYVDGRPFGVIPGVVGEAPNAGQLFRVPRGWRLWKATLLDATVVDEVAAYVGEGEAQLYAPASGGQCFWVEQRAYGRSAQPKPARLELSRRRRFHTLPDAVDAWFQPNPPPTGPDRWFSGGLRRAVRHGPCPSREEGLDAAE